MFKKDDYIVLISGPADSGIPLNYVYKQRQSDVYIKPVLDNRGSNGNGWSAHTFLKTSNHWRYATREEKEHYDKIGKPYDVTILEASPKFTVDNLINGHTYVFDYCNTRYINKIESSSDKMASCYIDIEHQLYSTHTKYGVAEIRNATQEESDWLDYCESKNTFVKRSIFLSHTKNPVNLQDLIKGKYYKITDKNNFFMIGKVEVGNSGNNNNNGTIRRGIATFITKNTFNKSSNWCYIDNSQRTFESASQEDIDWLNECIVAEKWMSREYAMNYKNDRERLTIKNPCNEVGCSSTSMFIPVQGAVSNGEDLTQFVSPGVYVKGGSSTEFATSQTVKLSTYESRTKHQSPTSLSKTKKSKQIKII